MPKSFDYCRNNGGKIRTESGPSKKFDLKKGEYRHVCWLGNKPYWGEKKRKKTK